MRVWSSSRGRKPRDHVAHLPQRSRYPPPEAIFRSRVQRVVVQDTAHQKRVTNDLRAMQHNGQLQSSKAPLRVFQRSTSSPWSSPASTGFLKGHGCTHARTRDFLGTSLRAANIEKGIQRLIAELS